MDLFRQLTGLSPQKRELYRKLHHQKQQIRLLRILPSSISNAPIRCELIVVSLQDDPVFDAISYCWGDPSVTVNIYVNNKLFPVTVSLHGALQRFRGNQTRCTVWADAICINQQDREERTPQVKLMHLVYSKAEQAKIWLGEADKQSQLAFDAMREIIDPYGADPEFPSLEMGAKIEVPVLLSALLSLLNRPWFGRIWVVQERQLAQQSFYYCGQGEPIIESHLKLLFFAVWDRKRSLRERLTHRLDKEAFDQLVILIPHKVATIAGLPLTHSTAASDLLESVAPLSCTNPRDKVFGVMGLAPWLRLVPIDYEGHPAEVYMAATMAAMHQDESLNILVAASGRVRVTLPISWMLELNTSNSSLRWKPGRGDDDLYSASDGARMYAERFEMIYLRLHGLRVGEVLQVGPQWGDHPNRENMPMSMSTPSTIAELLRSSDLAGWSRFLLSSPDAFWSVVLCDVVWEESTTFPSGIRRRRLALDDYALLSQLYSNGHPASFADLPGDMSGFLAGQIVQPSFGAKPFKLTNGRVGVSSIKAMVGDVVFVLAGSTFPYLLRPKVTTSVGLESRALYTLVSPCFVHGIMDGEAVKQAKANTAVKVGSSDDDDASVFQDVYVT